MSDRFRQATDRLIRIVSLADLARILGVSHGLLRQARLDPTTSSYRSPPTGWGRAVAKLARERATDLLALADELEANEHGS